MVILMSCNLTPHPAIKHATPASFAPAGQEALFERSLVSAGDTARLERVLAKARRGERVVIGVIGGSVTEGALASSKETCWGGQVFAWWRKTFPNTPMEFVNAGIGATGSDFGAYRVKAHLLDKKPDFIVAEYSVNDVPLQDSSALTMEGLSRQILGQPNQPALLLFYYMDDKGSNVQQWHTIIGRHYGLPMISYRDAYWPEVRAGGIKWESLAADYVHPNDHGHALCAELINAYLSSVLAKLPVDKHLPPVKPIPAPLISDVYEHTAIYGVDSLAPVSNKGWRASAPLDPRFGKGWEADQPGSTIEFEVEGKDIILQHYVFKGEMGMAEAQLDDKTPVKMNGWFDQTWGGYYATVAMGKDLSPGKHMIRVTLLDEKSSGSGGHKFILQGILAAGAPPHKP